MSVSAIAAKIAALPTGGTGEAPPGVSAGITKLLQWGVWTALIAGIIGVIIGGIQMAISSRNHGEVKGSGIAFAIIGSILAVASGTLIATITGA